MIPNKPEAVMMAMGILRNTKVPFIKVKARIEELYGPIKACTEEQDFTFTTYYKKEMGANLMRSYYIFEKLVTPDELPDLKLASNALEMEFAEDDKRLVNLDPGLLTLHSLILASCKDFSHRIYLDHGVYGEVTLIFNKGHFEDLPWTYPDYQQIEIVEFFEKQRALYVAQRKNNLNK